jgi:pyruvate formate lyase activating enzyme
MDRRIDVSSIQDLTDTEIGAMRGKIFNIQDYSIHDGPGIRTVVFFKGCPLSCTWCSNPESQSLEVEVGIVRNLCKKCLKCLEECPADAVFVDELGELQIDRKKCMKCGRCETVCPHSARKVYGREVSVDEVVAEVMRSAPFFARSEGGVTVSGGEPTLQWEFLNGILYKCRQKYVSTAIETCGYIRDRNVLEAILPHIDLFLYDIKCIDREKHGYYTGVSNTVILENARFISSKQKEMIVRVPVIPGFNDSLEEMKRIVAFFSELDSAREINLLPYHELGKSKYGMLDKEYPHQERAYEINDETITELKEFIESHDIPCRVD